MENESQPQAHVKTFGEVLPDCMIELVRSKPPQTGLQLLSWNGTKFQIGQTIGAKTYSDSAYHETLFEAPELEATLLQAIRFPASAADYSSDYELFSEVSGCVQLYTDLPENLSQLLAYCVFASWFSDCAPSPICISIMGPESRQGWLLFRILSCLFRRPLLLSDVNLGALCSLPAGLSPTLFLEQRELTPQAEKALYVPNARDTFIPWKGRLVNLCWAKVIRTEEPLNNGALGTSVIEIPVDPGCSSLGSLEPHLQQEIASQFQPKLLMYRLKNRDRIARFSVDFPDFVPQVREIACFLSSCVGDKPDLQWEMSSLLQEWNQQAQSEAEMNLNAIVLEVMLSFCHQEGKLSLRVAEIALAVNALLGEMGEMLKVSPKAVGGRLKSLGLYTKRMDAMGRGLLLTDAIRNLIHRLAWGCGVVRGRDELHCGHCKHFVQLQEKSKLPYNPLKGLRLSGQPDGGQAQSLAQPNPVPNPPSAESEEIGSSNWFETPEDQKLLDAIRKDVEF